MNIPTIEARLQKRLIWFSSDQVLLKTLQEQLPKDWQIVATVDLTTLGEWNNLLLYRFMLLDLQENNPYDPLEIIEIIRREYQINLPVFCFDGDSELQNAMRFARADRFFSRSEIIEKAKVFCEQYNWG